VNARGDIHAINRGQYVFSKIDGVCPLPGDGEIRVDPALISAGSSTDLLDHYIGSEGVLGVITELTLSLKPRPEELWGIVFFFEDQSRALDFVQAVDERPEPVSKALIVAIDFMDQITLECIREYKQVNSLLKQIPGWDPGLTTAVHVEIHGDGTEAIEALAAWLSAAAVEYERDPDTTWAFCGDMEMERLRIFRHAAPESVNLLIDKAKQDHPRITKLGTDMRLQNGSLSEMLEMFAKDLEAHGLKAAIFGHAADRHLHVNILPQNSKQFDRGRTLVRAWAHQISAMGGDVVTEHGVGKIKKDLFKNIGLPKHLQVIGSLKRQLDPEGLLNPGNIL